jgi:tRNA A-37 threonylcarbamoyl transferase component Bud32
MTNPFAISRQLPRQGDTATVLAVNGAARGSMQKLRCKLGFGSGSPMHLSSEVEPLLRHRLRLAVLITLAAFGIYLLRNLWLHWQPDGSISALLAVHSLVVAVMVFLAAVLWTTWHLSVRMLRAMELTLFGAAVTLFVFQHFTMFEHGHVLDGVDPNHQHKIASLATTSVNLRWFVLIVLYGTFIPNTWRRCATIVGLLAAIPLVLNLVMCTTCPVMGPVSGFTPLFDTAIILSVGSAIAIFGSYKISVLQQEAVVARELGQYRLTQKLGSGGMGEVFLGEHMLLRRKCAIKLIRADQAGDPTNLQRFEREVQAMATLTHANTVEIFDYGHADDGTFYYVMEYLPGLGLQELVDRFGPMPPERAVHFLRQLCSALTEAHSRSLIHRDIKPSNVIACERGGIFDVAKLLDFGLVQYRIPQGDTGKLTVQGVILGSPPYMAPEQALGRTNLDARTDIYSLGAMGYFLLTGQPPFVRETSMELLVAHAHEKPTSLGEMRPDVPQDLQAVVMRCLEKEPSRRFDSCDELEDALAQCDCADRWTKHLAADWWRGNVGTPSSSGARLLVG